MTTAMSAPLNGLLRTRDGKEFTLSGYVVESKLKRQTFRLDFSNSRFRDIIADYLRLNARRWTLGTVLRKVETIEVLLDYMTAARRTELTAEAYGQFLVWLRENNNHAEPGQLKIAAGVAKLYEFGIGRRKGWNRAVLDDMRDARRAHFRGASEREHEQKKERAISLAALARLYRALRLEMEACTARLIRWREAEDPIPLAVVATGGRGSVRANNRLIDPNPFVVFGLLAAIEAGLRSAEFNVMNRGDDERRKGKLYVHAPNKRPGLLDITPQMERALALAKAWSEALRRWAPEEEALLLFCLGLPAEHRKQEWRRDRPTTATRVTSQLLAAKWLPRFYQKYFEMIDPATGLPVLYADPKEEGDPLTPFSMSLAQARELGLTAYGLFEEDVSVVQKHARHKYRKTTAKHYFNPAEEDRLNETALRLAPMAERIRMRTENMVVVAPEAEEAERLRARGALVPIWQPGLGRGDAGGHCAEAATSEAAAALAAGFRPGCVRSGDCRYCKNFRIYVSRRPLYVATRDWKLEEVKRLRVEQNWREAENMRESAALDQAIIDRIDEHLREVGE